MAVPGKVWPRKKKIWEPDFGARLSDFAVCFDWMVRVNMVMAHVAGGVFV